MIYALLFLTVPFYCDERTQNFNALVHSRVLSKLNVERLKKGNVHELASPTP